MEVEQLELDLWRALETAVKFPQTVDFQQLCDALEREIDQQPVTEQLQVAAEVLTQLSQVYAARVELLLSAWERRYNPTEPVVDLEACVGLFVHSVHLDVADLFEPSPPVQYPAHRQARRQANPHDSLVGQVDKAALLSLVEQLLEPQPLAEVEVAEHLRQLAGEEDVEKWQQAIS